MSGGWRRHARAVARIARTTYPRFAFGLAPRPDEVPIFVFHDVTEAGFRSDLAFLAENGYETIGLDELADDPRPRSVVLTFDDARASFLEVAVPLLEEFDANAALFVPTAWVGRTEELPDRSFRFLDWDELRTCDRHPLVDVESHAHRHAMVPVEPRLADFASPETLGRFDVLDWPMRWDEDGSELLGPPPAGTPIFRAEPLLSAERCVRPDAALGAACRELARNPGFFERPDWRGALEATLAEAMASGQPFQEVDGELFARLRAEEFQRSRASFERELGRPPRHLAYPWCVGTPASLDDARAAGIEVVYGVALDFRWARRRGASEQPRLLARWKCDWLKSLPGRGRVPLRTMLARKLSGWSGTEHLAH